MLVKLYNRGSYIVHVILPAPSKAFTLSIFLPGVCAYFVLPGTRRYLCTCIIVFTSLQSVLYIDTYACHVHTYNEMYILYS